MSAIIDTISSIKSVPGVLGAFVVKEDAVIGSALPKTFKETRMLTIAREFASVFSAVAKTQISLSAVHADFTMGRTLYYPVEGKGCLVVVAAPYSNLGFLMISIQVAVDEIAGLLKHVGEDEVTEPAKEEASISEARGAPRSGISQECLKRLVHLLAVHVGPVSSRLVKRHLKAWNMPGGGAPHLEELVEALCAEIDDQYHQEEFRAQALALLSPQN